MRCIEPERIQRKARQSKGTGVDLDLDSRGAVGGTVARRLGQSSVELECLSAQACVAARPQRLEWSFLKGHPDHQVRELLLGSQSCSYEGRRASVPAGPEPTPPLPGQPFKNQPPGRKAPHAQA